MRRIVSCLAFCFFALCTLGQTEKARVFITDSQSWEMSGSSGGSSDGFAGHMKGGARPQTAEIIKTFGQRCPSVVVNNKQDKSNYVVVLDHEGGKSILAHDNKVAVFNSDGDAIVSHSTRSLGNSVKDACESIEKDWPARSAKMLSQPPQTASQPATLMTVSETSAPAAQPNQISMSSTPNGADIEIDGSYVGSTPSVIDVAAGDHSVVITKSGYKSWQRKIKVSGGSVNVSAELEKQ